MEQTLNLNELVIKKIREIVLSDIEDGSAAVRITSVEDGSLKTGAEGTEVLDNDKANIMTLYEAPSGSLSGSNSVFSADLYAAQLGSEKITASTDKKIISSSADTLTAEAGKLKLNHTPIVGSVKYVYKLVNRGLAEKLTLATGEVTEGHFTISGETITLPTDSEGTYWVNYDYESDTANKITKKTNVDGAQYKMHAYVLFLDKCNKNIVYTGVIIAPKAEFDPSSIELGLKPDGKHPFEIKFNKDYCSAEEELFSIIIDK